MARPVQKKIKELLEEFNSESSRLKKLETKLEEANRPAKERYEKACAKNAAKFSDKIDSSRAELGRLDQEIRHEIQKGYNVAEDSYSLTKCETDDAEVVVTTREQREIDPEQWIESVPEAERDSKFYATMKVLIAKAEKFRSDVVEKIAGKKRNHTVTVRLK